MKSSRPLAALLCAALALVLLAAPVEPLRAQQQFDQRAAAPFSQQELDQMLAPIALYPDALLAQVLMAATYPLEVVQAARFMQRNPGLSGDTLARAVEPMRWDPSVAALTQFPSVLAMMNEELDWTIRLGEAFLAQREQVMETVQVLREKARAAGTLRSNDYQNVIVRDRVIVIDTWRPDYYWVPYYNPLIVFGTWWWPAYPPFLWVPPVIYRPPYFPQVYSVGIVWGPLTFVISSLWNDPLPVWRDRTVVYGSVAVTNVIVTNATAPRPVIWQHDPTHRRSVEYRTPVVRDRYPPAFPEKPSRVSPSVQPSREPYPYPVPREPSVQVPRQPGIQAPREPGVEVPRQQVPVKPSVEPGAPGAPQQPRTIQERPRIMEQPRYQEQPRIQQPAIREPQTRQPQVQQPQFRQPVQPPAARQPEMREPQIRQPAIRQPEYRQPDVRQSVPRSVPQRDPRQQGGQNPESPRRPTN
ncbi:DUF3300 domain-containing protein [Burkholderiaceae bacterium FT117]|uniref:DUF3300 domain-containing protein n=1 Tax=Zeimonas sediminis TaxID=2944268 RepID=UPI0023431343|nr:DUF3300 domain-containing protein [Zeimonas sediminis]MCM5570395.1 DUF3300 domain-containing protein [Zeimonas sediminis]